MHALLMVMKTPKDNHLHSIARTGLHKPEDYIHKDQDIQNKWIHGYMKKKPTGFHLKRMQLLCKKQ